MPKNNKSINLLPQEEFEGSTFGKILKWVMTTFRYIVIVTEMVVMSAFLSRFWLDAQNSDLNDLIKSKSAQIESQKNFEIGFRNLQNKLKIFKALNDQQKSVSTIKGIASKVPSDVTIQTISIQEDLIQIKALSPNEIGIAQFISNLKEDKNIKQIDLGQTNTQESNQYLTTFAVNIKY